MYNIFMTKEQLNVKVGDRVAVDGYRGTVLEVKPWYDQEWDGTKWVKVEGTDRTNIQVHFDEDQDIASWGQYQDGTYSDWEVIK